MNRGFDRKFPLCTVGHNCPRRALYKGGCKDHCPDVVEGGKEIERLGEDLKVPKGHLAEVSEQRCVVKSAIGHVNKAMSPEVLRARARPCPAYAGMTMVFDPEAPQHYAIAHCEKQVYEACTGRAFDADRPRRWAGEGFADDVALGRAEGALSDLMGALEKCLRLFDERVASAEARVAAARERLRVAEDAQRRRKERWEHVDLNYLTGAFRHSYNVITRYLFMPGGWYSRKYLKRRHVALLAEMDKIKSI